MSSIAHLRDELAAQTAVIELGQGTYLLGGSELSISHDVTIRAAPGATVLLDAGGSSHVMSISSDTVNLIGLEITGGYTVFVRTSPPTHTSDNLYYNESHGPVGVLPLCYIQKPRWGAHVLLACCRVVVSTLKQAR